MRTFLIVMLCSLMSASAAFSQQADSSATNEYPSITLPSELDRVLRDYERAWRNHDAGALAALFTPDGFVLRPGHRPVRGREAIEEAYRDSGGRLHLRALSYEQSGSVAYIVGGYTSTPKWPDAGKFVLTLERGPDGRWLIAADMDNSNR